MAGRPSAPGHRLDGSSEAIERLEARAATVRARSRDDGEEEG